MFPIRNAQVHSFYRSTSWYGWHFSFFYVVTLRAVKSVTKHFGPLKERRTLQVNATSLFSYSLHYLNAYVVAVHRVKLKNNWLFRRTQLSMNESFFPSCTNDQIVYYVRRYIVSARSWSLYIIICWCQAIKKYKENIWIIKGKCSEKFVFIRLLFQSSPRGGEPH